MSFIKSAIVVLCWGFMGVYAQVNSPNNSWLGRGGAYFSCLQNPAVDCPREYLGPTNAERVQRGSVVTDLKVLQRQNFELSSDSNLVASSENLLQLNTWLRAPLGSALGFAAQMPFPDHYFRQESGEWAQNEADGQAFVLLASDLLALGGNREGKKHGVFTTLSLPLASLQDPWQVGLEWVWLPRLRLRGEWYTAQPHTTLEGLNSNSSGAEHRWQEQGAKLLLATRLWSKIDVGAFVTGVQWDSLKTAKILSTSGHLWRAGGSWQWVQRHWKWEVGGVAQQIERRNAWHSTSQTESVAYGDTNMVKNVFTSLARQWGNWRGEIWAEKRMMRGEPSPLQISGSAEATESLPDWNEKLWGSAKTESLSREKITINVAGLKMRYWFEGFFVEPGISGVWGHNNFAAPLWSTGGIAVRELELREYFAWVPSINLGVGNAHNRFSYSFKQAFSDDFAGLQPQLSWGAVHEFVVWGNF